MGEFKGCCFFLLLSWSFLRFCIVLLCEQNTKLLINFSSWFSVLIDESSEKPCILNSTLHWEQADKWHCLHFTFCQVAFPGGLLTETQRVLHLIPNEVFHLQFHPRASFPVNQVFLLFPTMTIISQGQSLPYSCISRKTKVTMAKSALAISSSSNAPVMDSSLGHAFLLFFSWVLVPRLSPPALFVVLLFISRTPKTLMMERSIHKQT